MYHITWNIYLTIADAVVHLVEFPIEGMSKKLQTLKGQERGNKRGEFYIQVFGEIWTKEVICQDTLGSSWKKKQILNCCEKSQKKRGIIASLDKIRKFL